MMAKRWISIKSSATKVAALVLVLILTGSLVQAQTQNRLEREVQSKERPEAQVSYGGFNVEMKDGSVTDVDSAWESVSGGALNIEIADSSTGADQYHTTTPGHKYVDSLTLRGPLMSGRRGQDGQGTEEILQNGLGNFKVEIEGAPTASANVESITMEDLVIDEREMTTGADWDYRVFGPGDAHYGSITIGSRVGKDSKELYQWWLECSQGKCTRKSISVIALKRDGSEARRWNFNECSPVSYSPFTAMNVDTGPVESVVARCGQVELDGSARKALAQWITHTVQGKEWKRTLTVKEILKDGSAGKSFTYLDCFPTRYVFPKLSASGTGNLYEEVSFKPIRLELN